MVLEGAAPLSCGSLGVAPGFGVPRDDGFERLRHGRDSVTFAARIFAAADEPSVGKCLAASIGEGDSGVAPESVD